jgi:hypothetical protein
MQVVIQHRRAADGDREDVRNFLKPAFDPGFAALAWIPMQ